MLAANTNLKDVPQRQPQQVSVAQPQTTVEPENRREDPRTLKIPEAVPNEHLRQEAEEEFDVDAEFDDDEIESELEDVDDPVLSPIDTTILSPPKGLVTPPNGSAPTSPTPRTPKRTLEEMRDEVEAPIDEYEESRREGTPPKRARLDDTKHNYPQPVIPSPIRLRKRSSEELEDNVINIQSGKRVKA